MRVLELIDRRGGSGKTQVSLGWEVHLEVAPLDVLLEKRAAFFSFLKWRTSTLGSSAAAIFVDFTISTEQQTED